MRPEGSLPHSQKPATLFQNVSKKKCLSSEGGNFYKICPTDLDAIKPLQMDMQFDGTRAVIQLSLQPKLQLTEQHLSEWQAAASLLAFD